MIKNYFILDQKYFGHQLVMFCKTVNGVYVYDHDKLYKKHIKHLQTLDCWKKEKRYTKTFGIPNYMYDDCESLL